MREVIRIWQAALEDANKRIVHKEYVFIDDLDFANLLLEDIKIGMKIYWQELLQRLHLASVTTLMRNQKWIQGICFGIEIDNYILFASSLRGYLEAFVDSYHSTNFKFIDLAENFSNIDKALKGNMDRLFFSAEFEESLIHFYSAAKNANSKTSNVEWLRPLPSRKYIEEFDLPDSELRHQLYSELCEIVHPASPSVKCFTKEDNSKSEIIRTVLGRDNELIDDMLDKYSKFLKLVFKVSNTFPVINLRTLNYFNEPCISATYIDDSLINKLFVKPEAWRAIENKLVID